MLLLYMLSGGRIRRGRRVGVGGRWREDLFADSRVHLWALYPLSFKLLALGACLVCAIPTVYFTTLALPLHTEAALYAASATERHSWRILLCLFWANGKDGGRFLSAVRQLLHGMDSSITSGGVDSLATCYCISAAVAVAASFSSACRGLLPLQALERNGKDYSRSRRLSGNIFYYCSLCAVPYCRAMHLPLLLSYAGCTDLRRHYTVISSLLGLGVGKLVGAATILLSSHAVL